MTPADMALLDLNWNALSPMLALFAMASACILIALFQEDGRTTAVFGFIGIGVAALLNFNLFATGQVTGEYSSSFGLRFIADQPALAFNFVILIGLTLAMFVSYDYLERTDLDHPEYYPLLLLSATGAMVMVAAGDLITLLLGLEIMSLPVYVLSAWRQGSRESEEAGMKYFLLGAFASAFLVYGIAMMYGATGSFVYADIAPALLERGFDREF